MFNFFRRKGDPNYALWLFDINSEVVLRIQNILRLAIFP
jgi:hypothetical protein